TVTIMFNVVLGQYTSTHFGTATIQNSLKLGPAAGLINFAVLNLGYFFFSYFFNHGQTIGLYAIKKRYMIPEKSFRQSGKRTLLSFQTCLTGGLLTFYFDMSKTLAPHDYLYQGLMTPIEESPISLLDVTTVEEEFVEEEK